jgi:hypothetical protein
VHGKFITDNLGTDGKFNAGVAPMVHLDNMGMEEDDSRKKPEVKIIS